MNTRIEDSILLSLWKWKFLSMAAISEEFFSSQFSDAAYKRMLRLRKNGFVQRLCLPNTQDFLWALTHKGFVTVRTNLPKLLETGFGSEAMRHDFFCSALHRGSWLMGLPSGFTLISEQELRRFYPEHVSPFIPKSNFHRPDGYTIHEAADTVTVTALEVELNQKSAADYAKIASFYSPDEVTRVLWLVPTERMANRITLHLTEYHADRIGIHQFVLLPDFLALFWNAPVFIGGEKNRRIHELFDQPISPLVLHGEKPAMLDLRRRPYRSMIYRRGTDREFLKRVALQASAYCPVEQLSQTTVRPANGVFVPLTPKPQTLEVYR